MSRSVLQVLTVYILLIVSAVITAIPLVYVLTVALRTNADNSSSLFFPSGSGLFRIAWQRFTIDNFHRLFTTERFGRHLLNALFLSSVASVLATAVCAPAGYALAAYKFRGKAVLNIFMLAAMTLPPVVILAPTYRELYVLRMLDSYWGVVLPACAPAFGVLLFRETVITTVPTRLLDAARIDGCNEWRLFTSVVLPLLRPMTGTFMLLMFISIWNNFVVAQIVLQSASKMPLSVAVAQLRSTYSQDYGLQMAGVIVSISVPVLLFLMLERDFLQATLFRSRPSLYDTSH